MTGLDDWNRENKRTDGGRGNNFGQPQAAQYFKMGNAPREDSQNQSTNLGAIRTIQKWKIKESRICWKINRNSAS
jgi:hypothetical protein